MKKTVIFLAIILLLNAALCACSGSGKQGKMNELSKLTDNILSQTEYLYKSWDTGNEIFKASNGVFDIAKLASATGYSESDIKNILQKQYGKDGEYDVSSDTRAYVRFNNTVFDEYKSAYYDLETVDNLDMFAHGYQNKYMKTCYNLTLLNQIYSDRNTFTAQKTTLDSLKGNLTEDECVQLISSLKELSSMNSEIIKKCLNAGDYTFSIKNKEEHETKANELMNTVKSLKARVF